MTNNCPSGTASAAFAACLVGLALISGCSPSDRPKIVPAKSVFQGSLRSPAPPVDAGLTINTALTGTTFVCADHVAGSVFWLSYGDKGRVERSGFNAAASTGVRFESGSLRNDTDRTGFSFEANKAPALYRSTHSQGRVAELFFDEAQHPVQTCFQKLGPYFIWMDSQLVSASKSLTGRWSCEGPLGSVAITEDGEITTSMGQGQAFLWSGKRDIALTAFFSGPAQPGKQAQYERFSQFGLLIEGLPQGQWSYETTGAGGKIQRNACARSAP